MASEFVAIGFVLLVACVAQHAHVRPGSNASFYATVLTSLRCPFLRACNDFHNSLPDGRRKVSLNVATLILIIGYGLEFNNAFGAHRADNDLVFRPPIHCQPSPFLLDLNPVKFPQVVLTQHVLDFLAHLGNDGYPTGSNADAQPVGAARELLWVLSNDVFAHVRHCLLSHDPVCLA